MSKLNVESIGSMTKAQLAEALADVLAKAEAKKARQKELRAERGPKVLTDEQKAKRYAYAKARRVRQNEELAALKAKVAELENPQA